MNSKTKIMFRHICLGIEFE